MDSEASAGAAIDVAEEGTLPRHDPWLRLPNLLATPHIASASVATRSRMAEMAVDNLLSALAGETPAHSVKQQSIDT